MGSKIYNSQCIICNIRICARYVHNELSLIYRSLNWPAFIVTLWDTFRNIYKASCEYTQRKFSSIWVALANALWTVRLIRDQKSSVLFWIFTRKLCLVFSLFLRIRSISTSGHINFSLNYLWLVKLSEFKISRSVLIIVEYGFIDRHV
jgi:hypothetical protein